MLSRELMGGATLAVLWVNMLLVAGAAWGAARPLPSLAARLRTAGAFAVVLLGATAGCTALALCRPLFGARGTVAALLGLALFLGAPPLGTALRDRLRRRA
jgi:hypothetical protein